MKKICLTLFTVCSICTYATAQSSHVSPDRLSLSYPGSAADDTISATGLTPLSGTITVDAPIKFLVWTGSAWDYSTTLSYTGGTLPPTVLSFRFGFSGSSWGNATITGGGVTAEICMRGNNPGYQCTPVSITQVSNEPSIIVSPNPAVNDLTISTTKNITSVTIKNLIGSTVYTQQCSTRELKLDIATLPKGIYFLKINDTEVRRFVKE